MTWIVPILEAILRVLIPALLKSREPTAEDSKLQPRLRDRLRARIRQAGWPAVMMLILVMVSGCSTRTVYVPPGEPVRLRETVRNAKVWVVDKDGRPVAGRMDLPSGWYALPDLE